MSDIFGRYLDGDLKADLDAAAKALDDGDPKKAVYHAGRAHRHRAFCPDAWRIMALAYDQLGEGAEAVKFATLYLKHGGRLPLSIKADANRYVDMFYLSYINMSSAPFYLKFQSSGEGNSGSMRISSSLGRYLLGGGSSGQNFWCAAYNPANAFDGETEVLEIMDRELTYATAYAAFYLDMMKAAMTREAKIDLPPGERALIAVAATADSQEISFAGENVERTFKTARHEFNFYRLSASAKISSAKDMAVSFPVVLKHSPNRRRLVLNILVDAFSWGQMKKENFRHTPCLNEFFGEGVIFDNNYSPAEFTYPSTVSMATGMHSHRTQVINGDFYFELPREYVTVPEQMKKLGYYCVSLGNMSDNVYNGLARGFDRLVNAQYFRPVGEFAAETIAYLEAFDEADNFLRGHVFDVHQNNACFPVSLTTQAKLPWHEVTTVSYASSVNQPMSARNFFDNHAAIERVDRYLGILFDYIRAKYREDEYVVFLYSDHGVSFYNSEIYYLGEEQNCAALMMRGAGIPKLGHTDELTSGMDLYPIMGKVLGFAAPRGQLDGNLPRAFGGKAREYVISQSIYPGQTYKLCLRTAKHEARFESCALTNRDGTVDLREGLLDIYTRDAAHKVVHDAQLTAHFLDIIYAHTEAFNVADSSVDKGEVIF